MKNKIITIIFFIIFQLSPSICTSSTIVDETNISAGTVYKERIVTNVKNAVFQYKLIAGLDNTVEIQFWATVYMDADNKTDDDWINITELLTGSQQIIVSNSSMHDFAIMDTNCTFGMIKIKCIVTGNTPDNRIKINWNTGK